MPTIETSWGTIPAPDPTVPLSRSDDFLHSLMSDNFDPQSGAHLLEDDVMRLIWPSCSDHTLKAFAGAYRGSLPFVIKEFQNRRSRMVWSTEYDESGKEILIERPRGSNMEESEIATGTLGGFWSYLKAGRLELYESYMKGKEVLTDNENMMENVPAPGDSMEACRHYTYVLDLYPSPDPPTHSGTLWVNQGRPSPSSSKLANPKISAPDLAAVHLIAIQHPDAAKTTEGSSAALPTANILREIVKSMKYELPCVTAASTQRALSAAWMTLDALKTPYHVSDLSESDNIIFPNCNTGIAQEQQGAPLPNMVQPDSRRPRNGKGGLRHLVTEFDCDGQEDFAYAERPDISPREHLDLLAEHIAELADRAFASKVHYTVVGSESLRRSAFGIKAGQDPMDELQTEVMRLLEGRESSVDFKTTEEARKLNLLVGCWHRHPDAKEILRENVFTTRVFPPG
ncbi:uncharacterized protein MKK02DRAFT_39265 [Dioszegia hungarica]|uniref:Uncharacterized protein n=1 Tax=Dioszegia hungarica TaxID=4972 RepID=A0AA38LRM6_9TREE|nr:uncharacterized protein MKK02DRAFT_39265 [Dioszegia hungarica]KAI9633285.1 hypothetical protein MKK02DRAFT_39265 [Dioszegia hungarica]